ncbi:MAG: prepilin peptidase [Candidatus Aenigmarchaeota archaeon]|nr:prepilin peptidase [Candidatus Aenigmarchaeota archaeon]
MKSKFYYMFEEISIYVAFVGSSIAGIWDLKTTEIPDSIPHAMILIALIIALARSFYEQSLFPLAYSLACGSILFVFGFALYYSGQWGGGDAKILSAVGFLIPNIIKSSWFDRILPFPFSGMVSYTVNVFFVGTAYMLLYSFVLALVNRKILTSFSKEVKASSNLIMIFSLSLFFIFIALNLYLCHVFEIPINFRFLFLNSLLPLVLTIGVFTVWKFTKSVEEVGFKKRIPVSKLKVGDVLAESKLWEGITQKELIKIKKSGKKYVRIKEGVRFAPAFPLALLFTVYFGDFFPLIFRLVI